MNSMRPAQPPLATRLAILVGGLAVLALVLWFILPHSPALPLTASQQALRPGGVTQGDYQALRLRRDSAAVLHTSYPQAVAMMGEGTLVNSSADGRTRTYQWNGGGRWARLEATFRDGYLISKKQVALKEY